jgi:hypothetical protein
MNNKIINGAIVKSRIAALVYRIAAFILITFGIIYHLRHWDIYTVHDMLYYSVQSNILICLWFGYAVIRTAVVLKKGTTEKWQSFHACLDACMVACITLTFIIFWFFGAPIALINRNINTDAAELLSFYNLAIHLMTPVLMVLDYVLFQKHGQLTKRSPYFFCIFPAVYLTETLILGLSGAVFNLHASPKILHYPYIFMDFNQIGWLAVLGILAMVAAFFGGCYAFYKFDTRGKNGKTK